MRVDAPHRMSHAHFDPMVDKNQTDKSASSSSGATKDGGKIFSDLMERLCEQRKSSSSCGSKDKSSTESETKTKTDESETTAKTDVTKPEEKSCGSKDKSTAESKHEADPSVSDPKANADENDPAAETGENDSACDAMTAKMSLDEILERLKLLLVQAGGGSSDDDKPAAAGADGADEAADGADEAGDDSSPTADGSDDSAPKDEAKVESLDGKVKFSGDSAEDAKKSFDNLYANDADFKKTADEIIAKHGSLNVTTEDFTDGNSGKADINGNNISLDHDAAFNGRLLAHELLTMLV